MTNKLRQPVNCGKTGSKQKNEKKKQYEMGCLNEMLGCKKERPVPLIFPIQPYPRSWLGNGWTRGWIRERERGRGNGVVLCGQQWEQFFIFNNPLNAAFEMDTTSYFSTVAWETAMQPDTDRSGKD